MVDNMNFVFRYQKMFLRNAFGADRILNTIL